MDGIACDLVRIAEDDVPDLAMASRVPKYGHRNSRGETSLCQAIDRIVGGWTYQGWKGGYFDSEEDARIFYDECRWLLCSTKNQPHDQSNGEVPDEIGPMAMTFPCLRHTWYGLSERYIVRRAEAN